MRAIKPIMFSSCVAVIALALLGSSSSPPDPAATMVWSDAVARSVRDGNGDIVSTLHDPRGNSLGVLMIKHDGSSVEWSPVDGVSRSMLSQSSFAGGAGLQEANALAYTTWKPGGEVRADCQSECSSADWCCTCEASGGGSCLTCCALFPSDRDLKANFEPVRGDDVLNRLAAIPITNWNYKSDGPAVRHIGPMAQDFRAAFGLGSTDKAISVVDASGVALAAIQSLNRKVETLAAETAELRKENQALRAALQRMVDPRSPAR